ncbi:lactonase family protein [Pantoea dispersa]|uniref:lactonase family protein n=1 Tax=Pantoea dispersa TaxID=59814 RepID=UPI0021B0118D|nr:lactonase family protein [Pantoea dispersa]MCT6592515.1 lactonase family protein [Pantoea dispersa]MCW0323470.1 6-phosphogluconolactonase [Pantoea dispersa]MCW0328206.1 6-phosphogluconolactonase [Pantoea dispersa]MCW0434595.1 6-phosphogluconolactonase [Pantoea dispersa]
MALNLAYVGCRTTKERDARGEGIATYEIDSITGQWRHLGICPAGDNPSFLIVSEKFKRLYSVHGDGATVSSFRLNEWSGMPEYEETIRCHGENPVHLTFDRAQKNLLIVNYASGNLAGIRLDEQGRFKDSAILRSLPEVCGPHKVEQRSSHPHFIGRIVNNGFDTDWYVIPDKGSDTVYAAHLKNGQVAEIISGKSRESAAPRHAVIHPFRSFIYIANELDSTLTTWHFDPDSKTLSPIHTISVISPQRHTLTRASGIDITADGGMVYVSNRGDNSVAQIEIDPMTGLPVSVSWVSSMGDFPRFLCLSPEQRFLYVANERSDSIVQFSLDKNNTLTPTGQVIETGSPVCLAFYQLSNK